MKISELNQPVAERAVLVGLINDSQNEARVREYLDELAFLADTAGAVCVRTFTQRLDYPNPRTFVGKGKLEEIAAFVAPAPAGITADSCMHTCAVEIDSPLLDGYRSEAMLMPFRGADGRDYVYIYIDYYPIYVHTVSDLRLTGDLMRHPRL